jgi:porin
MKRSFLFILVLGMCLPAAWAETEGLSSWWKQPTITGDWKGLRPKLAEKGFTFEGNYYADFLGNPIGGRRKGFQYAGSVYGAANFDPGKLTPLKGARFHISFIWGTGSNLSAEDIGNQFTVSNIFIGDSFWLWRLYWEQSLFDNQINIRVGRITAEDDFAASPLYDNFVSAVIDDSPISFTLNAPGYAIQPAAYWGARVAVKPGEKFYVMAGVFNSDPNVALGHHHGVDFKLNPEDGVFMIFETAYLINEGKNAKGMPGHYKFGAYYDTACFRKFSDSATPVRGAAERGNYGFYFLADQMIYREPGSDPHQGLSPFAVFTMAPSRKINTMPWFMFGGLCYQGLIPKRDQDIASVGFARGWFSDKLAGQNYEMMVEANYQIYLTPALYIQPDFQYIFNPGGTGNIKDAMVLGAELGVNF